MKICSLVCGASFRRQVLWLLAVALAAGGLACTTPRAKQIEARELDKALCPQPRDESGCTPAPGVPPTQCTTYEENSDWLPPAYVINATCVCEATVDDPTADCVRAKLQAQTAATPEATREQGRSCNSKGAVERDACIEKYLKPLIYQMHVNAYEECCCPCNPPPYASWEAVTVFDTTNCQNSAKLFDLFGSCHGTPGKW